jgi:biopolymer transport protein ExbD
MAGGMDLGQNGKGGKKPLDTAINLVPFIDLMAVTISFLILTAAWTQIGRLQVASAGNSSDPKEDESKIPPLTVTLTNAQLQLSVGPSAMEAIPVNRDPKGALDLSKLELQLKDVKTRIPDEQALTVQSADDVKYDDLVRLIDTSVGAGIPSVSLSPLSS